MLYPVENDFRRLIRLDGIWDFVLDPEDRGVELGFPRAFPRSGQPMAVPASYNDIGVDTAVRDHIGPVWYRRSFFVPTDWRGSAVVVRVGAASHHATLYVNGVEAQVSGRALGLPVSRAAQLALQAARDGHARWRRRVRGQEGDRARPDQGQGDEEAGDPRGGRGTVETCHGSSPSARRTGGTDGSLPLAGVSSDGTRSVPEEHAVALLADDRELVVRGTCRIGDEGEGVRTPGERHPGLVFDELSTEALARVVELHGRAATRPPDVYVHDGLDRGPVVQGVVEVVVVLDLELFDLQMGHAFIDVRPHRARGDRDRPEEPVREGLDAGVEVVDLVGGVN